MQQFKQKLEQERELLRKELETVGRVNPDNPLDWEPRPTDTNFAAADPNEVADTIEDFEQNTGILKQLEIRWNEVKNALDKIEKGTYGTCEVSGDAIEKERLEANPAARTCMAHKDTELQ
ncbi:MAG: hypothetical protein RJA61_161 [Candidatus Parcubacteria bacterium]